MTKEIEGLRIPKSSEPGIYKKLHRRIRAEGSTKNLGPEEVRKTITLSKDLLQKLETMSYWRWRELWEARDLRADKGVSVSDIVVEILEKYVKRHPPEDMPVGEYLNRLAKHQDKVYRKSLKRSQAGK